MYRACWFCGDGVTEPYRLTCWRPGCEEDEAQALYVWQVEENERWAREQYVVYR